MRTDQDVQVDRFILPYPCVVKGLFIQTGINLWYTLVPHLKILYDTCVFHKILSSVARELMMWRRGTGVFLAFVVLAVTIVVLFTTKDTVDVNKAKPSQSLQFVSTDTLLISDETVYVSAFAEIRPRWSAELRSAVSGRVEAVLDTALAGEPVEKNTVLITIEKSAYQAEMAAAELAVKEAELALSMAKKATAVARKQFERDGITPPNDLALHLPQLRIAESALNSATAGRRAAKRRLEDATVKAPFSGFVTERYVSPGQSLESGEPLVKLVDDNIFELIVEVSRRDWLLLKQPLVGLSAQVLNQHGHAIARAKIRQGGGFLDEKTRQYQVFLEISKADKTRVFSGDFVQVLLPGIRVPSALTLAESSLTQEGYIWYLDSDDRLQRAMPEVLFRHGSKVVIRAPGEAAVWRVATTPLSSFLPGLQVRTASTEE
jgi:RND family efflux transporter MFP subunit